MRRTVVVTLLAALACAGAPRGGGEGGAAPGAVTLTVLSTNDFHGALSGVDDPDLAGPGGRLGGVEYLAGMVSKLRAEAPGPTLLLDAGDCFQGELAVNASEGMACVRMFNLLKYDAVTIGNHEFDYLSCGPDEQTIERGPEGWVTKVPPDPRCALRKAVGEARYAVVSANVRDAATGERGPVPGARPYAIVDVGGGVKVGVTGVVTRSTPMVSNPGGASGLSFTDPVLEVRDVLPGMRAEGAGVIVVLAHVTGDCRRREAGIPADGTTPCKVTGELADLADGFGPGEVDLIVAGHSHVFLAGGKNRVPVMEGVAQGRFLGHARIAVDPVTRKAAAGGVRVLPPVPVCRAEDGASRVCSKSYPGFAGVASPDAEALRLREEADAVVAGTCRQVVATATADIVHDRGRESALANLAMDLMREAATPETGALGPAPADFAFMNMGATRDSLRTGPISACDLHRVWPFEDRLAELSLTGEELASLFGFVTGKVRKALALSGGTLVVHGGRGGVELLDASGKPVDPARTYRVVTTLYLLRGGDRVNEVLGHLPPERVRILSYPTYRDALRLMMSKRGRISPPTLGRIVDR
ncbi:MAG: bifunctional metallophosphatase/5'-nucleotidase [Deltaproteobacteria bacterium]|nr:bifunctional metallophosphatase/5'-nucleotidase [Deltaproteobacteria bacterium]